MNFVLETSSPPCGYEYEVFLSFRGKDTRKNFTDHLYEALDGYGFRTFKDDDEIRRGEAIKSELERGIENSRVSLVILSKTYASSRWCLDELVQILRHRNDSAGKHVVIPIFYDVDVHQLKIWRNGNFDEALNGSDNIDKEKVDLWREALREVSDLGGMLLQNEADGHEAKFIKKIVRVVGNRLTCRHLSVPPYLVGVHSSVEEINLWLQDGSTRANIMMICGMGGIGKTTLAKLVYNQHHGQFDSSSFLSNIQDRANEPHGLVGLQKQLLLNVTRREENIGCLDEGIIKIQKAMCSKRVLLIIDDVDHVKDLNAMFGLMPKLVSRGSKIILTTRNEGLLRTRGEEDTYYKLMLATLDETDSLKLFSLYAFGQDQPIDDYLELSEKVVHYCGGLPLAIQVLGSSLSGRSKELWDSMLQKLEAFPDSQILEKLRISFECLQDDQDRELFLDIACFFVGRNTSFATRILDECGFHSAIGIQNLVDRSLLTIDEVNNLTMHHLLQDMGRELVRLQSPKEPGKRSRLWNYEDSFDVLKEQTGTDVIEGLILDISKVDTPRKCSREELLEINAFANMKKLRILQLNHDKLSGKLKGFPDKLRWLCWRGFHLHFLPDDFPMRKLVVLEMQNSSFKQVWKKAKFAAELKVLDLSYSRELQKTPDFSKAVNLEMLILEGCSKLIEIHESIQELKRLVVLNLKNCSSLRKLPKGINMLKYLDTLIISGCSSLDEFPNEMRQMSCLKELVADRVAINAENTHPWLLRIWNGLERQHTINRGIKPISLPSSLVSLSLQGCYLTDDAFASIDFSSLSQLLELNLSDNMISCIPEVFKSTNLEYLTLNRCPKLKSIFRLGTTPNSLPCKLFGLSLEDCKLTDNAFCSVDFSNLSQLRYLFLSRNMISCLPDTLKSLSHLLYVSLNGCPKLKSISGYPNFHVGFGVVCYDCANLVEFENWYKFEPMNGNDIKLLTRWGFSNLESLTNAQVYYYDTRTTYGSRNHPPKRLYDYVMSIITFFLGLRFQLV